MLLVVTATSNEPVPVLSPRVTGLIKDVAETDDGTVEIGYVEDRRLVVVGTVPVTPHRESAVEHDKSLREKKIKHALAVITSIVDEIRNKMAGLDVLTGLVEASHIAKVDNVVVLSSGLSTVDPVDWRTLGFSGDTNAEVRDLARRHFVPDLNDKHLLYSGLGATVRPQAAMPKPVADKVVNFWLTLCAKTSAASCDRDDSYAAQQAAAPTTVKSPLVLIPTTCTRGVGPGKTEVSVPDALLGFAGNRTELPPTANSVLKPIIDLLRDGGTVTIVGHTADYGGLDGQKTTSSGRAHAVATRMIQLGLPRTAITRIDGVGPAQPVPHQLPKAPANRRVTFTINRTITSIPVCHGAAE
jgi:outer membrane protein OmpA-like peptidoglycan-associated protein